MMRPMSCLMDTGGYIPHNDDLPSIDAVPEEVELDVDVLAPVVEDRVLGEGDGGLVVHHQSWRVSFLTGQLA